MNPRVHSCKDKKKVINQVKVNAALGPFGATDWSLDVRKGDEEYRNIALGGSANIDKIIQGIEDYYSHKNYKLGKEKPIQETLLKEVMTDLWIDIGKWAAKNNLNIIADVALIPSEPIQVEGKVGVDAFSRTVTPKCSGQIQDDEFEINLLGRCNFYLDNIKTLDKVAFRLSSDVSIEKDKLDDLIKKSSCIPGVRIKIDDSTRYVDFNPLNDEDENEIRNILSSAKVIYIPNIKISNVKTVFYEV